MVAADQPSIEERVAILEQNVQLLAVAMKEARTWLVLIGSVNADRYTQLHELSIKAIDGIEEVRRLMGGES